MSKVSALFHIVFATKGRMPAIKDSFRDELHRIICAIVNDRKSRVIAINSVNDHVHILLNLSPTVALSDLISAVKAQTSGWLRENDSATLFRGWGEGYYGCSVSPSISVAIIEYIRQQPEHHRRVLFDKEIQSMCEKWRLAFHPNDLR